MVTARVVSLKVRTQSALVKNLASKQSRVGAIVDFLKKSSPEIRMNRGFQRTILPIKSIFYEESDILFEAKN